MVPSSVETTVETVPRPLLPEVWSTTVIGPEGRTRLYDTVRGVAVQLKVGPELMLLVAAAAGSNDGV